MAQNTVVVELPRAEHQALRDRLGSGVFEWRRVPHAAFSVKGEGVVATLYQSGKLVVQGELADAFLARYAGGAAASPPKAGTARSRDEREAGDSVAALDVTTIGSDETGKGDYFGPLVVAAARVEPKQVAQLAALGVMDSKKVTDGQALKLAVALRALLPHVIVRLDPEEYNARYPKYSGLNPLLADLHAEAIRELATPGVRVLVDRFANEKVMQKALRGIEVELEQATRAERNPAVAAASILARAEFLIALTELAEEHGHRLHKGAGAPVDSVGAAIVADEGPEALGKVAKLHFKNTLKIQAKLASRR